MSYGNNGVSGIGCGVLILLWSLPSLLIAFWTDRSLEYWLEMAKGHAVEVPYWISLIITFVGNAFILAANIITELLRLVL